MDRVIELAPGFGHRRLVTDRPAADQEGDAALVARLREGDTKAFETLYERHARMIHGIVLARAPREDAEDLVQEVFLAAYRRIETLRDGAAFAGWLAMIARNRAADHHRRAPVEISPLPEDAVASPPPPAEALEVLDIIRGLPEAYRDTLILRLVEGMTGPEIAERTGLSPGSVRVNLHRGMKMLRERLGWSQDSV
jgi:RNA polymerase sigma-70 factor (ECF subfamily)